MESADLAAASDFLKKVKERLGLKEYLCLIVALNKYQQVTEESNQVEILNEASKLFSNHNDLAKEFLQFLPSKNKRESPINTDSIKNNESHTESSVTSIDLQSNKDHSDNVEVHKDKKSNDKPMMIENVESNFNDEKVRYAETSVILHTSDVVSDVQLEPQVLSSSKNEVMENIGDADGEQTEQLAVEMEINVEQCDKCRTCGRHANPGSSLLLPKHQFLNKWVASNMKLEISSDNGLPYKLCLTCMEQIKGWIVFNSHCKNVQSSFTSRKLLQPSPLPLEQESNTSEVKTCKPLPITKNCKVVLNKIEDSLYLQSNLNLSSNVKDLSLNCNNKIVQNDNVNSWSSVQNLNLSSNLPVENTDLNTFSVNKEISINDKISNNDEVLDDDIHRKKHKNVKPDIGKEKIIRKSERKLKFNSKFESYIRTCKRKRSKSLNSDINVASELINTSFETEKNVESDVVLEKSSELDLTLEQMPVLELGNETAEQHSSKKSMPILSPQLAGEQYSILEKCKLMTKKRHLHHSDVRVLMLALDEDENVPVKIPRLNTITSEKKLPVEIKNKTSVSNKKQSYNAKVKPAKCEVATKNVVLSKKSVENESLKKINESPIKEKGCQGRRKTKIVLKDDLLESPETTEKSDVKSKLKENKNVPKHPEDCTAKVAENQEKGKKPLGRRKFSFNPLLIDKSIESVVQSTSDLEGSLATDTNDTHPLLQQQQQQNSDFHVHGKQIQEPVDSKSPNKTNACKPNLKRFGKVYKKSLWEVDSKFPNKTNACKLKLKRFGNVYRKRLCETQQKVAVTFNGKQNIKIADSNLSLLANIAGNMSAKTTQNCSTIAQNITQNVTNLLEEINENTVESQVLEETITEASIQDSVMKMIDQTETNHNPKTGENSKNENISQLKIDKFQNKPVKQKSNIDTCDNFVTEKNLNSEAGSNNILNTKSNDDSETDSLPDDISIPESHLNTLKCSVLFEHDYVSSMNYETGTKSTIPNNNSENNSTKISDANEFNVSNEELLKKMLVSNPDTKKTSISNPTLKEMLSSPSLNKITCNSTDNLTLNSNSSSKAKFGPETGTSCKLPEVEKRSTELQDTSLKSPKSIFLVPFSKLKKITSQCNHSNTQLNAHKKSVSNMELFNAGKPSNSFCETAKERHADVLPKNVNSSNSTVMNPELTVKNVTANREESTIQNIESVNTNQSSDNNLSRDEATDEEASPAFSPVPNNYTCNSVPTREANINHTNPTHFKMYEHSYSNTHQAFRPPINVPLRPVTVPPSFIHTMRPVSPQVSYANPNTGPRFMLTNTTSYNTVPNMPANHIPIPYMNMDTTQPILVPNYNINAQRSFLMSLTRPSLVHNPNVYPGNPISIPSNNIDMHTQVPNTTYRVFPMFSIINPIHANDPRLIVDNSSNQNNLG